MSEATNTPVITLEELQLGETVNTTTAAQVLHHSELYGRAAKRKSLSSLEFTQRHVGDSQGQLEEGFFGLMRPNQILSGHQTGRCVWWTASSSMVVAASCCEEAPQQLALRGLGR